MNAASSEGMPLPRWRGQRAAEVPALDVLHGQEHVVADPAEVEDGDDVLLDQRHRELGLADEHVEEPRIAVPVAAQPLDHQALLDARDAAPGEVDVGHPTPREGSEELVASQRRHPRQYTVHPPDGGVAAGIDEPRRGSDSPPVRRALVVCVALAATGTVRAAPAADVVVAWSAAPLGPVGDAVSDTAARAGASYVDASPEAVPLPDPRPLIKRGIAAYGSLEFDAALTALDAAAGIVDQTGAALVDATALGDLFLHRALTHTQRGEDSRAWDDFLAAASIDPTRVLDPAGFPPRAVERFAAGARPARRHAARAGQARRPGELPGARGRRGGRPRGELELAFGRHWLDAACDGRAPVRHRLVVDRAAMEAATAGPEIKPPDDAALLIQARSAAARAMVAVTIVARTAVVRRLGVDGKEQDRASLALRGAPVADARTISLAVGRLLAPPPPPSRTPWYRSRWAWAAAGAAAASAILIPFAVSGGGSAPSVTVHPSGVPEDWK